MPADSVRALRRVHDLLLDPDKHTRRALARDREDNPCCPGDREACKFCVLGALDWVIFNGDYSNPTRAWDIAVLALGGAAEIALFNDKARYADILPRIAKAADILEKEGLAAI